MKDVADTTEVAAATVTLRILSTTDVHGHLLPYDYYTDTPNEAVGLSRLAALVASLKTESPEALLFDSGDFLQGTPLADQAMEATHTAGNPVIQAMNLMGYDAGTLGNHEFNFGLDALGTALRQAKFPVVSSNLSNHGLPCPPGLILRQTLTDDSGQQHDVSVGVLGLVPPQITQWDRSFLEGRLEVETMIGAAAREAKRLTDLGADVVVALCHSGMGVHPGPDLAENAALSVAACANIDLVLAGHTHDRVARAGHDGAAPVIMAGCWGSHLGLADLRMVHHEGRWHIVDSQVQLREIANEAVDDWSPLTRLVDRAHRDTIAQTQQPVGHCSVPLHTYFALVGPSAAMQVVAEAQTSALSSQLGDSPWSDIPILSAVAPFKAGGFGGPGYYTDIPAGPLSLRDVGNLYLYPNIFCGILSTGREVRLWLMQASNQFRQIKAGTKDENLLEPSFASHGFDILFGVTYSFDLAAPRGDIARVTDLRLNGRAIADDDRFIVATNGYRAGGGGGYPVPSRDRVIYESAAQTREIVQAHVAQKQVEVRQPEQVFRFAPMADTHVVFETGLGADAYSAEIAALGLVPLEPSASGFLRYRLTL